jgi:molybdate transport system ATP-binding protein
VGYVFQNLALFPHLTAEQNITYGLSRLEASARRSLARGMLEQFHIANVARRRPAQLSGGERQRVALARSLVIEPQVLLLDEPLAALDLPTQSQLIADLRSWNREHPIPILYVTHSQREVFALGERVVVLEKGKILAQGQPQEVLRAPRQETVAQLAGVENIFDARVVSLQERLGTMTCRLEDSAVELEIPLAKVEPGAGVRIAIHAGDILMAVERPRGLSARNLLAGRVLSLEQQGIAVHARVDCGVVFQVRLTPGARESLLLDVGREVWLVIKTYSCHLLEHEPQ